MATTYETVAYRDPAVAPVGVCKRVFSYTPTTAAINDVYRFFKLPKGAKLVTGWAIESADIDTNATPTVTLTLRVTDGTTTKNIIVATTAGQAGGITFDSTASVGAQTGWLNYRTASDDFRVEVLVAAAAATFAAGAIKVCASYTMDSEVSGQ